MRSVSKREFRYSTIIRNNHIHDLYDEIKLELGCYANEVSRNYIYRRISEKTGLCIRTVSNIINHTHKIDITNL